MMCTRSYAIVFWGMTAVMPLTLGQACMPFGLGGSTEGNTFEVTLYQDGVQVKEFSLGSSTLLPTDQISAGENTSSSGGETSTSYAFNAWSGVTLYGGDRFDIRIRYNDSDNIVPMEADQLDGSISLAYFAGSSSTVEYFGATGQLNLTRSASRLSGDFDVTMGRLRAVGTVDLPETYNNMGGILY